MDSGDIYRVTDILEPNSYKCKDKICKDKIKAGEYIAKYSKNLKELIEVKTILTHEQYDNKCYKID